MFCYSNFLYSFSLYFSNTLIRSATGSLCWVFQEKLHPIFPSRVHLHTSFISLLIVTFVEQARACCWKARRPKWSNWNQVSCFLLTFNLVSRSWRIRNNNLFLNSAEWSNDLQNEVGHQMTERLTVLANLLTKFNDFFFLPCINALGWVSILYLSCVLHVSPWMETEAAMVGVLCSYQRVVASSIGLDVLHVWGLLHSVQLSADSLLLSSPRERGCWCVNVLINSYTPGASGSF